MPISMSPDLIKILLLGLLGALALVTEISIHALSRQASHVQQVRAAILCIIAATIAAIANDALSNPEKYNLPLVLLGGYCYVFFLIIILWREWMPTRESDRNKLLKFIKDELQERQEKLQLNQNLIEVRAEPNNNALQQQNQKGNLLTVMRQRAAAFFFKGTKIPDVSKKTIVDIFNQEDNKKELLILGEPGSGKTISLVILASQLCEKAEQDKKAPIPIILELSSWQAGEAIYDWIAIQLNSKYGLPDTIFYKWFNQHKLVLLLDGLDELKNLRDDCIDKINEFRKIKQYNCQGLVICSRIKDYNQAVTNNKRIHIDGQYRLSSLSNQEIEEYLNNRRVEYIWQSIMHDTYGFLELARQPLLLDLIWRAYRKEENLYLQCDQDLLIDKDSYRQACQKKLLTDYVKFQLEKESDSKRYAFNDTKHYLKWLAKKLKSTTTTEFLLENMQPSWLDNNPGLFHSKDKFEGIKPKSTFTLSLSHIIKEIRTVEI